MPKKFFVIIRRYGRYVNFTRNSKDIIEQWFKKNCSMTTQDALTRGYTLHPTDNYNDIQNTKPII